MTASEMQRCDTTLVSVGDSTWERIGDELVVYVYGRNGRIRVAGDQLAQLRSLCRALDSEAAR